MAPPSRADQLHEDIFFTPTKAVAVSLDNPSFTLGLSDSQFDALLHSRYHYFACPAEPFGKPKKVSRDAVKTGKVDIPGTADLPGGAVKVDLSETDMKMAVDLSDHFQIDEVEAAMLYRRYLRAGLEDSTTTEDESRWSRSSKSGKAKSKEVTSLVYLLGSFYSAEVLWVCKLLAAVLRTARSIEEEGVALVEPEDRAGVLKLMARDIEGLLVEEGVGKFVGTLFSGFATMAQKPVSGTDGPEVTKLWILHYLQVQTAILEALFLFLYYGNADIDCVTATNTIMGAHLSGFGTQQANYRLIQKLPQPDTSYFLNKIEALVGLIAIEALSLSQFFDGSVVVIPQTLEAYNEIDEAKRRLCHSTAHIAQIQGLIEQSPAAGSKPFGPFLLAWAVFLTKLPAFMVPRPSGLPAWDLRSTPEVAVALALQPRCNLFANWNSMLAGPLLSEVDGSEEVDVDAGVYKDSNSVILRGVSEIESISLLDIFNDYKYHEGLLQVWCTLYGKGEAQHVEGICRDFWDGTRRSGDKRNGLLAHCHFPHDLKALPRLLGSLVGTGSIGADDIIPSINQSALDVYGYLENIYHIVLRQDAELRSVSDLALVEPFEATDMELISPAEISPFTYRFRFQGSGWTLLLHLMAAALGDSDEQRRYWAEKGVNLDAEFVEISFALIENLVRSDLQVLNNLKETQDPSGTSLLHLVVRAIYMSNQGLNAHYHQRMFASAVSILAEMSRTGNWGNILVMLRDGNLFGDRGVAHAVCRKEQKMRSYPGTLALLRLVGVIGQRIENELYKIDKDFAKEQAKLLRNMLAFAHEAVWTGHLSWEYRHPAERARITRRVAQIYTSVARHQALQLVESPLMPAHQMIVEKIVLGASQYDIEPIFQWLEERPGAVGLTGKESRSQRIAEQTALRSVLALANAVLGLRTPGVAPLARAFLERVPSAEVKETPMDRLVRIITSAKFEVETSWTAAGLLERISRSLSQANGDQRGLMPCFTSPKSTLQQLYSVVADPLAGSELTSAVWMSLSSAVQCTPSLAYLCAGMREDLPSSTVGDKTEDGSILSVAMEKIVELDNLWKTDPALLLAVMTFTTSLLVGRVDLLRMFNKEQRHFDFWNAVGALAGRHILEAQAMLDSMDEDTDMDPYQRYSRQKLASAGAIELLGYVLDTVQFEETSLVDKTKGMVKSALELSSTEAKVGQLVGQARGTVDGIEGLADAIERLKEMHASVPVQALLDGWRLLAADSGVARYETEVPTVAAIIDDGYNSVEDRECLDTIATSWNVMATDEAFSGAVGDLIANLADVLHLQPEAAGACGGCAPDAIAELPAFAEFQNLTEAFRQESQYHICADLLEVSLQRSGGLNQGDWTGALKHLTRILPDLRLGEQLFETVDLDRKARSSLYRILLYTLVLQPSLDVLDEDRMDSKDQDVLRQFFDSLAPAITQSLSYTVDQALAGEVPELQEDLKTLATIMSLAWQKHRSDNLLSWLSAFDNQGIISQLFNLLIRDYPTMDRNSPENIYAPLILQVLSATAQLSGGAIRLVSSGVVRAFDMTLTMRQAENGRLRPRMYGESHAVWTQMLEVLNAIVANLPQARLWVSEELLPFVGKASLQFKYACSWSLSDETCLLRLSETCNVLSLMGQTVSQMLQSTNGYMSASWDPEMLLRLLSAVTQGIQNQKTLKAVVEEHWPMDGKEAPPAGGEERDLRGVNDSLLVLGGDIVQVLKDMTRATDIVCGVQESWRAASHLALPVSINMQTRANQSTSSIRILMDFLGVLSELLEVGGSAGPPDSANLPSSPLSQTLTPMSQDTRRDSASTTMESCWLLAVAQGVMLAQLDAAQLEADLKMERSGDKPDGGRQAPRLNSLDIKALQNGCSLAAPTPTSGFWRACTSFLKHNLKEIDSS